jgi:hypothetical protein
MKFETLRKILILKNIKKFIFKRNLKKKTSNRYE